MKAKNGRRYIPLRISLKDATLQGEIWKDVKYNIEGVDGIYIISNLGRIYSKKAQRILKLTVGLTGKYHTTALGERGKRKHFKVHRLVAEAFIPNPEGKKEVNHKNKNRRDNRVENLEWVTAFENSQHKYGKSIWHKSQGRIVPTHIYSAYEKKMEGFSGKIIPIIKKLVPFKEVA